MLPALAAWVWAACAVAPDARLPERATEPVPELPGAFSEKPDAGAYAPLKWWRAFADPVLDEVVETVLEANLDMAGAVARVEQARVRVRLADAAILPAVGVRAGVDSFDVPVNAGIGAQLRELGLEVDVLGDGAEKRGASPYVESALATSERNLALARLAAHRALGGGWTAPEPMTGVPLMAASLPAGGPKE